MTGRPRYVAANLAIAAACFVTGTLGLTLYAIGGVTTLLWIPSGIGLAIVLLKGPRWLPGVWVGVVSIMLTRWGEVVPALLVATVNVGEIWLGWWFLRRLMPFRPELDRVRDVISFVEVCIVISLLSATVNLSLLFSAGVVSADRVTAIWAGWWWSHLSADLIVAPALLTSVRHAELPFRRPSTLAIELVALVLTVLILVLIVLGRWLPAWLPSSNAPYYLLPMLLWAGVRFGPRGAAFASFGACMTAIVAQSFGLGPFEMLFDLQSFIAISSISTLMLSALAMERVRAVERRGAIQLAALDGIVTVNRDGRVVEINPAAERLFALPRSVALGKDIAELVIPPRLRAAYRRELHRYARGGSNVPGTRYRMTAWRASDNVEFPVEVAVTRVPVEDHDLLVTGFVRDLTLEQQAQAAVRDAQEQLERKVEERTAELVCVNSELERREAMLRQAEELAHLGSFDFDLETKKLGWSDELFRIYGRDKDTFKPSYEAFVEAVDPEDRAHLQEQLVPGAPNKEPIEFEERIRRPDGSTRFLQTRARVLTDDADRPVRLVGCCQDITERKQNEMTRSRLVQLVESSDDAMLTISADGTVETWNAAATKMFGYEPEEILHESCERLVPASRKSRLEDLIERARAGEKLGAYELTYERKDGSLFEAAVTTNAVFDRSGQVVGIAKVMRDITDQKAVEKQMRASLLEKEVLLREIHHRVKNNLQVIASLLNLQLSAATATATNGRKGLVESQNRIQSMALVHQLLYQSKDLAQIDAGQYLTNLVNRLVQSYNVEPDRIAVHVTAVPLQLDIDRAIPCGLVVNELVTNALTHAFPEERHGQIWVSLEAKDDQVVLTVADDGVGIPAGLHLDGVHTFGLRIAHTLAMQLEGTLALSRDHGTRFALTFPYTIHRTEQAHQAA